jgi:hypothetical protein
VAEQDRVHAESFPATPLVDGTFSLSLGAGGDLDSAKLARPALWAEVRVGGQALLRQRVHHVPHAAFSAIAGAAAVDAAATPGAPCAPLGALAFHPGTDALVVCASGGWDRVGSDEVGIVTGPAGRLWADGLAAMACEDYLNPPPGRAYSGATGDGVYVVDRDGVGPIAALSLYCDMANGGWALVGKVNGDKQHGTTGAVGTANLNTPAFTGSGKLSDADINALIRDTWRVDKFDANGVFLDSYTAADAAYGVTAWYSTGHPSIPSGSGCGSNPNNYCGQRTVHTVEPWNTTGFLWYHTYPEAAYSGLGYYGQKGLLWVR